MEGVYAGMRVFDRHGIDALQGANGQAARELWDIHGFDDAVAPTDEQMHAASAWDDACEAALKACCEGWAHVPAGAGFCLKEMEAPPSYYPKGVA